MRKFRYNNYDIPEFFVYIFNCKLLNDIIILNQLQMEEALMVGIKSKIIDLAKSTNANKSKVQTEVLVELLFYRMAIGLVKRITMHGGKVEF